MAIKWVRRRAHTRRLPSGACVHVAPSWVPIESRGDETKGNSFHSACPVCDAPILRLRMPNGGWVHYERGIGLARLKHPCFYLGEDIANARDEATGDLFAGL